MSEKVLTVALTGGIGSGKSTAGEFFADLGATVVDSDQLSRDVIARGMPGFDVVVSRFGDDILRDGQIDRGALGEIVFRDSGARGELEAIVHPAVRAEWESVVAAALPGTVVINQIPLLVETRGHERFDRVVTVSAPIELRQSRLRLRGMKDYQIERVLASQVDDAAREAAAQFVIINDSDTDHLLRQVENIYEKLQVLAGAR